LSEQVLLTLTSSGPVDPAFAGASLVVEGGDGGADGGADGGPVVPEPSSAVLLMLGAAGMVARRRRS